MNFLNITCFHKNSFCPKQLSSFTNNDQNFGVVSLEEQLFCHEELFEAKISRLSDSRNYEPLSSEPLETTERVSLKREFDWFNLISYKNSKGFDGTKYCDRKSYDSKGSQAHEKSEISTEKSPISEKNEFDRLKRPEEKKWSGNQDKILLKLAPKLKYQWKKIADKFGNNKITVGFLRKRYQKLSESSIQQRTKFSYIEDLMIAKYFNKYGSNWTLMAIHFTSRTPIMLKNRYYSWIRKRNLLEPLVQKVKEIEKKSGPVENLGNKELQANFNISQQSVNKTLESSLEFIDYSCKNHDNQNFIFGVEQINGVFSAQSSETKEDLSLWSESQAPGNESFRENPEIKLLKNQVANLEALFFKMKSELDEIKAQDKKRIAHFKYQN